MTESFRFLHSVVVNKMYSDKNVCFLPKSPYLAVVYWWLANWGVAG